MCEQLANRDGIDRAKLIVHLPKFRHIAHRAVIQRQLAPVAQLQNSDCGHCLGDRGPVVRRFSVDGLLAVYPCLAEKQLRCQFLHVDYGDPTPHHPMLRQNSIEEPRKCIRWCPRRGCSDQGTREQRGAGEGKAVQHDGHDNTSCLKPVRW
jgi:hypothetical protein